MDNVKQGMACWDPEDEFYFAATEVKAKEFDPTEGLEEDTVVLDNDTNFGDVFNVWTISATKWLCKKGKGYHYPFGPVGLLGRIFGKRFAMEAMSKKFESMDAIVNFMKDNRGLVVYQVIENTVHETYLLRYFVSDGNMVRISLINYIYNYFKYFREWNKTRIVK